MGGGRLATRMGYREFSGSAAASVQQLPLPRIRHPLPPSHPFLPSLYSKSFSSSCQCGGNAWMVVVAVVRVPLMVGAGRPRKKRWKEGGEERERPTPPKKRSPGKKRPQAAREEGKSQVRQGEVDNDLLLLWPSFVFGKWRESSRLGGVGRVRPPLLYAPSSSLFA